MKQTNFKQKEFTPNIVKSYAITCNAITCNDCNHGMGFNYLGIGNHASHPILYL